MDRFEATQQHEGESLMAIGDILRRGASMADSAADAVTKRAAKLKDKASSLAGDAKDEVVFEGAIDQVRDALIAENQMTPDINNILKAVSFANPYKE